jgi:hypothetical protein
MHYLTPLVTSIFDHSAEKMLLNCIEKDSLDFTQQIADFCILKALKDKKEPQLKAIKNRSSQINLKTVKGFYSICNPVREL